MLRFGIPVLYELHYLMITMGKVQPLSFDCVCLSKKDSPALEKLQPKAQEKVQLKPQDLTHDITQCMSQLYCMTTTRKPKKKASLFFFFFPLLLWRLSDV